MAVVNYKKSCLSAFLRQNQEPLSHGRGEDSGA
jgi:hypothetical protein